MHVEGSGFTPVTSIEILFNNTTVENVSTNLSGRFEAEFVVPQSAAGNAEVTAREELFANSATAEFEVLNDAPVAEHLNISTNEDVPLQISLSATDANGDTLVYSIVKDPENGSLTRLDEESGTVTYVPNENYYGSDTVSFKVNDGLEDSNIGNISISIFPVNDPPSTEGQELNLNENGEVSITLIGSDPDGDELTYSITEDPVSGSLTGEPPNLIYRPSSGFSGSDGFSFVANDGELDSNVSRVDLTVAPVNDVPSATDISTETNEDESVTVTLTANDSDSDSLTFTIMTQPSHGTLGQLTSVNSNSSTVVYTPAAEYSGADIFTFSASDGDASSDAATVNIDINPVNDAPIANDQSLAATAGESVEITLTGTDPDGDVLNFDIVEGVKRGTLGSVVSATGTSATVSYSPNPGPAGSDSFTFRASDGSEQSNAATVSITLAAQSNTGSSGSASTSQGGNSSEGAASSGTENTSPNGSNTGGEDNNSSSDNTPSQNRVEVERAINDEVPIQDNEEGIAVQDNGNAPPRQESDGLPFQEGMPSQAIQSLTTDTVEGNPFLNGPAAWLLPGAIAGLASVVAFLGYRERRLKKGYTDLQSEMIGSADQPRVMKESTSRMQAKPHRIQDRIAFMVGMNKIHRILENEKETAARERILDVEYNKSQASRTEYENSKSIVKNQFEQIGTILRSNPALMESFMESFGDLTIKVWWAIKQDVHLDMRRGRKWESLDWLGSEAEKHWSTRGKSSSQVS